MAKTSLFVHISIEPAVRASLVNFSSLLQKIQPFEADPENVFKDETLRWQDTSNYAIVVIPGEWSIGDFFPPGEIVERVLAGSLRFVIWDIEHPPDFPLPVTMIPKNMPLPHIEMLLSHVMRVPAWGLQTLLPKGSKIFTERIRSESQITRKVEQTAHFVGQQGPEDHKSTLALRANLHFLFAAALGAEDVLQPTKPATFQIGVGPFGVACSIRWRGSFQDFQFWQSPPMNWNAFLFETLVSVVQLNAETQETEILAVMGRNMFPPELLVRPWAVDVLSRVRLDLTSALQNDTENFEFEYFVAEDKSTEAPTTFVSTSADEEKAS